VLPGSTQEYYKLYYRFGRYFPVASWLTLLATGDVGYGDGYGNSSTCGNTTGFTQSTFTTFYCNIPDSDCAYPIAGLDGCAPAASASCSSFDGDLLVHQQRFNVGTNYDYIMDMPGHRYRFAAANCGTSGNITMRRSRGPWATR
jgi:hypothetical protein